MDAELSKEKVKVLPLEKNDIYVYGSLMRKTLKTVQCSDDYLNDLTSNAFSRYFKMVEGGTFIGALSIWHVFEDIQILTIGICPSLQGRGFGNQLMLFLLDYAKMHAVERLSLEVRLSNQVAIQFYEKFGFKKEAIRKNYYNDGEDAHLMVKYV
ncbi:ribosomal protein S18-alanine N-acetyltransferase [Haloplasma contractile]|uniref:[Ribosomal protein bS18]-alanine N-acetyltransferase n=1 Tax=Haloplasma contractile SSD-17B TaxID=1033810 RepID=U2EFD1_9MOLU|nr:ribosomal protein S18-alanine N-acetyltransferase [Haloplasma contractile]ERJ13381.1 Putative ribosomal-protein-alanine acetyltransferase [Haloplasma contractile SSD-17B]